MLFQSYLLSVYFFLIISLLSPLPAFSQQNRIHPSSIVDAHNLLRNQVGSAGLKWSDQLAEQAARYTGKMQKNGCEMNHNGPGENLYWASPLQTATEKNRLGQWQWHNSVQNISEQAVVESWAAEKQWYSSDTNTCHAPLGKTCGHYTQIVWADTTRVGCAKAMCEDKSQVWLCIYSPAGNIIGQTPY
ncbi:MAG: CAP domain-containing protein [Pseudomonadota bacterium]